MERLPVLRKWLTAIILFIALAISNLNAQTLKGYTYNRDLEPVSLASIYVKSNPMVRAASGSDGEFSLDFTEKGVNNRDIIIISCIGYKTQEIEYRDIDFNSPIKITLDQQSILLEGVSVSKKVSKKIEKKVIVNILERFKAQIERDFTDNYMNYKVVSDIEIAKEGTNLFKDNMIGEFQEVKEGSSDGKDTLILAIENSNNFLHETIVAGINEMERIYGNDTLVENNKRRKKKKDKNMLDSSFYKILDDDREIVRERSSELHSALWGINNDMSEEFKNIDMNPKNWTINYTDKYTILTYREKNGLLGIYKVDSYYHFIVDPSTLSLEKISSEASIELHIPFGYKLPPDALMLLNVLNVGDEPMDKYRVRHLYLDMKQNNIFKRVGDYKYPDEKNLNIDFKVIDNKKRDLPGKAKALINVISLSENENNSKPEKDNVQINLELQTNLE